MFAVCSFFRGNQSYLSFDTGQVKTSSTPLPAYQVLVLNRQNCLFPSLNTFVTHAARPCQTQLQLIFGESVNK